MKVLLENPFFELARSCDYPRSFPVNCQQPGGYAGLGKDSANLLSVGLCQGAGPSKPMEVGQSA